MMDKCEAMSQRMRAVMRDKHICIQDVSGALKVSPNIVSKWYRGLEFPPADCLKKVAFMLDVPTAWLTGETGYLGDYVDIFTPLFSAFQSDKREVNAAMLKVFSRNLRELRINRRLWQREVASAIGVGQTAFSRWERGKRLPDALHMKKLCDFFGVSEDYLLPPHGEQTEAEPQLPAQEVDTGTPSQDGISLLAVKLWRVLHKIAGYDRDYWSPAMKAKLYDAIMTDVKVLLSQIEKEDA